MVVEDLLGWRWEAWEWETYGRGVVGTTSVGVEFEGKFKAEGAEWGFLIKLL